MAPYQARKIIVLGLKEVSMGNKHQSDHDKGQRDGSRNEYRPPVSISPLDEFIWPQEKLDEWKECNDAYDKGWSNGYDQR
jgi:hypothetical protein